VEVMNEIGEVETIWFISKII